MANQQNMAVSAVTGLIQQFALELAFVKPGKDHSPFHATGGACRAGIFPGAGEFGHPLS